MIDDENIAAQWWRWWTNPCEGMHPDKIKWLKAQGIEWADRHEPSVIIKILKEAWSLRAHLNALAPKKS